MRCIWSRTANVIRRVVEQRPVLLHPSHRLCTSSAVRLRPYSARYLVAPGMQRFHAVAPNSALSAVAKAYDPNAAASPSFHHDPVIAPDSNTKFSTSTPLTPAQMSRAAAQAVRICFRDGVPRDAFYVVNSARYSEIVAFQSSQKTSGVQTPIPRFKAIDFGQTVSSRLSAHALLHGLVRLGLTKKAAKLGQQMMNDGIKLRTNTLQTLICSLPPNPPPPTQQPTSDMDYPSRDYSRIPKGPDILNFRPEMVSDQCTRFAVRLLFQARHHHQHRTDEMFHALISACLFQGELIVASLLFVLVVKDWELRKALAARLSTEGPLTHEIGPSDHRAKDFRRFDHLRAEGIFPSEKLLSPILQAIDAALCQEPQGGPTSSPAALQALANLAMVLDDRLIPIPGLSPLIRSLYSCPKTHGRVWVKEKDRIKCIDAHSYFHRVIMRLIDWLPSRRPPRLIHDPQKVHLLPPLDLSTYNSLLHYALRHRLSPALANKIIHHMTKERHKPLEPDIVTYNILLRSGTLLWREDISEKALRELRLVQVNHRVTSPVVDQIDQNTPFRDDPLKGESEMVARYGRRPFSALLTCLKDQKFDLAPRNIDRATPLLADSRTLTAYVTHLTSTGKPHAVADILFHVLPELSIIDHPSWGNLTLEGRWKLRIRSRQVCLERAVALGPYFFCAVLNALRKAGKTGLTERVWLLAKEAERVSWLPDFAPGLRLEPWCLPVHAYTTMLQCYAAEARKGLRMRDPGNCDDMLDWTPRSKENVKGWARFILSRRELTVQYSSRRAAGQKAGIMLFRSMRSGARSVYGSLIDIAHSNTQLRSPKNVQIPIPDARFFNAALDLFARQPFMCIRSARTGRAHWRRKLRLANLWYAKLGTTSKHWNPLLQQVAEEVVNAGYSVPPGLRHLFVGRWPHGTMQWDDRYEVDRRPYAFPDVRAVFKPHALPTSKTRGLPLRGKRRTRGRERTPSGSRNVSA